MSRGGLAKRHSVFIGLIQQAVDIAVICSSLWWITWLLEIPWRPIFNGAVLTASLLFWLLGRQYSLYGSWRTESIASEVRQVLATWVGVILCLLLIAYALKISDQYSRRAIGGWMVFTPLALAVFRTFLRNMLRQARVDGRNQRRVAVAGSGSLALDLISNFRANPWMGIHVAGVYDNEGLPADVSAKTSLTYLGDLDQLLRDARSGHFDEIYIALPMTAAEEIHDTVDGLADCSVQVNLVPDLLTFKLVNSRSRNVGPMPVISVYDSPLDDSGYLLKRIEDIAVATICLAVVLIPMFFIAAAIKLTSRGPVIFRQRRYGLSGEEIWVWKFRTMSVCEDGDTIAQAQLNDERVTPLGAFLRRNSLDELPQFFNVLQGSMSVVGPRPHAVAHNEEYRATIDGYMLRHLVKPGITGWAQVNGWRGETDTLDKMEQRIEHDLYYIRNWSLRLDIFIILMTVLKGFGGKRAY
ncbi:MAG: undecaprenyl-phosphate glucose phosphotransferase [Pseudomonadota bacterium]